jgi:hypothetical protein
MKFELNRGHVRTGVQQNLIVSYFPETKPDWWCSEYEFVGAVVRGAPVLSEA